MVSRDKPRPSVSSDRVVDCPYCASIFCMRVERQGWADFLRRLFGFYPWCCKTCQGQFSTRRRNYKPGGRVSNQTALKSEIQTTSAILRNLTILR